ncbi:MAG: hypothetical protein SFU25_02750 [Candidatus Caenarcaniphilales bacterium]|nr:hypothetical protein [Candidatus Caenarcaniphilales bacterium]
MVILILLWLISMAGGAFSLWKMQTNNVKSMAAPNYWPKQSALKRSYSEPTLIAFIQPYCKSSHASVKELEKIMAKVGDQSKVFIVLVSPKNVNEDSPLINKLIKIPDIIVQPDSKGQEARVFGAQNSGQILAYDSEGSLRFVGGLGLPRNHKESGIAKEQIQSLVLKNIVSQSTTKVIGCSLFNESKKGDKEK